MGYVSAFQSSSQGNYLAKVLLAQTHHGRRHDFGTGGAELEVGSKNVAALARANF